MVMTVGVPPPLASAICIYVLPWLTTAEEITSGGDVFSFWNGCVMVQPVAASAVE